MAGDDSTFFRHTDLNVRQYLEDDHGDDIIQELISLNDEVAEDIMTLKNHPVSPTFQYRGAQNYVL